MSDKYKFTAREKAIVNLVVDIVKCDPVLKSIDSGRITILMNDSVFENLLYGSFKFKGLIRIATSEIGDDNDISLDSETYLYEFDKIDGEPIDMDKLHWSVSNAVEVYIIIIHRVIKKTQRRALNVLKSLRFEIVKCPTECGHTIIINEVVKELMRNSINGERVICPGCHKLLNYGDLKALYG